MTSTENKKAAAVYCRVSTDEQAKNGLSVETQESICRREAEKDGYANITIIKDEGRSGGSIKGRPGIQKIIEIALGHEVSAVYVIHSDRLARNTFDHLTLRDLFRKNDVQLRCVQQPMLDDSAVSRTMDTVMASFNEMQRLITAEKVMSTMTEKAKAGYWPNKAPIGYQNVKNSDSSVERVGQRFVVPDSATAPLVRKAFELYATGNFSVFDLTDLLHEKGLRTKYGRKLSYSRMFCILKNRFYTGELHWGKVDLKQGKHEAIVSEVLFNSVQRMLDSKNRHACRRRKYSWLLNGFLWCYKHEMRYTAEWHLNKSIGYYHCRNRSGCGKYVEVSHMEQMVAEKFKTLEFSPEFIELVIEKARGIFYERRKGYDQKRKGEINQRTALEVKRKMAEGKLFAGIISDDDFTRIKKEISEEIQQIDDRLAALEQQRTVNVDVAQEILNLTRNIYDAYEKASSRLKREYLAFFWDRFEVADGLIIKSTSSLLFDQLLKLEQACQKNENLLKPIVSNSVIKSAVLSAH